MKALIVEDEPLAAERLQDLLLKHPSVAVLAVLNSVAETTDWLAQNPAPDLIFADIQLTDGLSFEIFDAVPVSSPIVFTTSYDEYALKAFSLHSLDYLLKPIKPADLARAVDKYDFWRSQSQSTQQQQSEVQLLKMQQMFEQLAPNRQTYRQRFLVTTGEQLLPIAVSEIAYFHTAHELVYLVREDGRKFSVDYNLERLETMLDPAQFFRLNRQYLSSMKAITRINSYFAGKLKLDLKPDTGQEVLVSRERSPALKRWLE